MAPASARPSVPAAGPTQAGRPAGRGAPLRERAASLGVHAYTRGIALTSRGSGTYRPPAAKNPCGSFPTRSPKGRLPMLRITLTSVAVLLALALALGPLAGAQQRQPQPPPPWKQGQPANMADSTLAPIAQPPAPKASGEIPVDKIKVPAGFKVSLWAHGINNAREMVWGDKGTLFVS